MPTIDGWAKVLALGMDPAVFDGSPFYQLMTKDCTCLNCLDVVGITSNHGQQSISD